MLATPPLGSKPAQARGSPGKTRQRHRKIVAKPSRRRQIPIDRAGRTAEPEPARGFLP